MDYIEDLYLPFLPKKKKDFYLPWLALCLHVVHTAEC
jgi:hypothetical protein